MKRILAALMFFTRLPLWRIAKVPSNYFSRVVELWPLAGWLTGGFAALVLYVASLVFPIYISVLLAICSRVLLTGALHEDGLADFCDGFGGGTSRDKILQIMKDSHIGTYGVLALLLYFLLLFAALSVLSVPMVCYTIIAGDCWSKFCSAQIVNFLPYARTAETSKSGVIYQRFSFGSWLIAFVIAALPLILLPEICLWACLAPVISVAFMIAIMKIRIGGYTGDCCGATFLISELTFYLTIVALWY